MATPTPDLIPSIPGAPTLTSGGKAVDVVPIFVGGKPPQKLVSVSELKAVMDQVAPNVSVLTQTVAYDDMTDGGSAVATLTMTGTIPAGAILLGTKLVVTEGYVSDTSAALTVGDGTDVDRYMTGTPSILDAAAGVETGLPSGSKLLVTANQPVLTVTTAADYTSVDAGSFTISIYYIETVDQ